MDGERSSDLPTPPAAPQTSGMAIASLVLGILSFICLIFTGIPAIVLGAIALGKINRSQGQLKGSGLAIAGIATGCVSFVLLMPALLLPAIQAAREAARRNQSINNIKQIELALLNYESAQRQFPAPGPSNEGKGSQLSWRVRILPYLDGEGAELYKQFHLDEPWDSPHNRELIDRMPQVFDNLSPGVPAGKTTYLLVTGPGTAFNDAADTPRLTNFRDGTSNTILLVEANSDQAVEWTKPADWQYDPNNPTRGLGTLRPHGFLVGFADGSVTFVNDGTDPEALKAMMTRAGEEPRQRF